MIQWFHEWMYTGELCFDDVLIRPNYSEISSRFECDTNVSYAGFWVHPIISANMTCIATPSMISALNKYGCVAPAHRFQSKEKELESLDVGIRREMRAISVGLEDRERVEYLADYVGIIFLELAHAGTKRAVEETKWLRDNLTGQFLIVGNVATYETAAPLFDAGADMVKVGVGPGSVCKTREVTGVGVPQLSAILDCARVGQVIADGGIRNSGDIVKALAAGATSVMIGSLLAGTNEASGSDYYGMASREAGRVKERCVPEGIAIHNIPNKGSAVDVVDELLAGVRQGMSMIGARNWLELKEKAVFQLVSPNSRLETSTHFSITHK